MKRAVVFSVIDQALLSILSLMVGVILIRFATPDALGRYALVTAVYFLFASVQNSLVSVPISTRVFGRNREDQNAVLNIVCTFDLLLVTAAAGVTAAVLFVFGLTADIIIAGVGMVVATLMREVSRSALVGQGRMVRLMAMDAVGVVLTLGTITLLWPNLAPEVACLGGTAAGMATATLILGPRLPLTPKDMGRVLDRYREYFNFTRWSLVGGIAYEAQTRGYVFAVQLLRGASANGLLQASRLLISPVELLGMAMARVTIPRMSALVRAGDFHSAYVMTGVAMTALTGFGIVWGVAIWAGWPLISTLLISEGYTGIGGMVAAWCAFTILFAPARCLEWLFVSMERFRGVATVKACNAAGVLSLIGLLALPVPLSTVVVILAASQVVAIGAYFWMLRGERRPVKAEAFS